MWFLNRVLLYVSFNFIFEQCEPVKYSKSNVGSLKHDVPLEHLNTHFSQLNCRYTIVSQVEPHILPFFYCPKGSPGAPEIVRRGHGLRGGFFMSFCERFIKLDIVRLPDI